MLDAEDVLSAVIFCNRKTTVRELNKSLQRHGYKSGEIHGDIDQSARIAELERFRAGTVNILVASDVAARGLDIKGVSHVFNFDAPWHPDDYVHRIGRTGRAGAKGVAYTFVTSDDAEAIDNIQKLIKQKIETIDAPAAAAPAAKAKEEPRRPEKDRRPDKRRDDRREEPRAARSVDRAARSVDNGARPRRPEPVDDGPDEGWNGPVPEFLSVGFGI